MTQDLPQNRPSDQDGYLAVSADLSILRCSRRTYELWGLRPEEVAEVESGGPEAVRRFTAAIATRVLDVPAFLEQAREQHACPAVLTSHEIPLRDGRTLSRYGAPLFGPDGAVNGRAIFYRDLTAVKQAEARLSARISQQAALLELSALALGGGSPERFLERAARTATEVMGVDGVEIVGPYAAAHLAAATGGVLAIPLPDPGARTGDQQPLLCAHSRVPRIFGQEERSFLETLANLIAAALARRAAEERAREEDRQCRAIFDSALDVMVVLDDGGRVVDANPAVYRLTGLPCEALLGQPIQRFVRLAPQATDLPSKGRRACREEFVAFLAHGRAWGELELSLPGAGPRRLEYSAVASIRPGRHLAVVRDVTERQQLLARLALADRMVSTGTLAAGVAHELNNPLAYVDSNLSFAIEQLQEEGTDPAQRAEVLEALREAREGAQRMRGIIRELQVFSSSDDRESRAPVDLALVLGRCVKMAGNEIRQRAGLVLEIGPLPPVLGHEGRLGQLFLNLLVNAAQAIRTGSTAENEVRLSARALPHDRVEVEVRDTGCGIPAEHLGRIFDPFFTTKEVGAGTGLGLAICAAVVQGEGGRIEVESSPGNGTAFKVTLHAAVATAVSTRPQAPDPVPSPPLPAGERRRARVLVVDDEPRVAAVIQRTLRREHDVEVAPSGRVALDRIRAGASFDLILADLLMPEMTGMDLHRELVCLAPTLAQRMLFVTGGAFTDAARAFLAEHRRDCIDKPFEPDALRELVRVRLAKTQTGA